jgi:hypothetical protein
MTRQQRRELHAALVKACPTQADLNELVFIGMGVSLDAVTSDGALTHRTAELLQWAESNERISELIEQATNTHPTNPELRAYIDRWGTAQGPDTQIGRLVDQPASSSLMPRDFEQMVSLMNFAIGWFAILSLICLHILGFVSLTSVALVMAALVAAVWVFRRQPARGSSS